MKYLASTPHEGNPQEAGRSLFVLEAGDEQFGQPSDVYDNLSGEVLDRGTLEQLVTLLQTYAEAVTKHLDGGH